jgi:ferrous-iron efflux pump FieF
LYFGDDNSCVIRNSVAHEETGNIIMMQRADENRLMQWATYASVMVAVSLVALKSLVWLLSDSMAMLGSLTDSALDLAASLVTLIAVRTAITPPDEEHRFGHGKAEALAGLFQAGIMSCSAAFLALNALERLWSPQYVEQPDLIMKVSVLAIALSFLLVGFQSYVVRKTGSLAVAGDHLHYKGDLLLNLGVILAAFLAGQGLLLADGLIGAGIAVYILWGAYGIARPAINMLMDREFSSKDREAIFNLVLENPDVLGMHDLKTRMAGRDQFIQMHIDVDGELTVHQAHFIAGEVEATLSERFPRAEIMIHVDPPSEHSTSLTLAELSKKGDPV